MMMQPSTTMIKTLIFRNYPVFNEPHFVKKLWRIDEQEGILSAHASIWSVEVHQTFSVNYLRSIPVFAGCFLELNDTYMGCYVLQTCSLRYRDISTLKVSLL